MTCFEKLEKIKNDNSWFGCADEFVECCEEKNLAVEEINSEYASVDNLEDDDDVCLVYFGGAQNTIIIKNIAE